jgi:hypothetical protein
LFGVFDVSPKGTEAKEASNLLAFPNTNYFPKKSSPNYRHVATNILVIITIKTRHKGSYG